MQESFLSFLGDNLQLFLTYTGVYNATPGHIIMILVGLLFIFLAIRHGAKLVRWCVQWQGAAAAVILP